MGVRWARALVLVVVSLLLATLAPTVRAAGQEAVISRVSTSSTGAQAVGQSSTAAVAANGRHVAFESLADDLVSEDTNGAVDVFVKDLDTDVTARVSVRPDGTEMQGASISPTISADGRFVAFVSFKAGGVMGSGS